MRALFLLCFFSAPCWGRDCWFNGAVVPEKGIVIPKTVYVSSYPAGRFDFQDYFRLAENTIQMRIYEETGLRLQDSPHYPEEILMINRDSDWEPEFGNGFSEVYVTDRMEDPRWRGVVKHVHRFNLWGTKTYTDLV